jgi:hypothetical protein
MFYNKKRREIIKHNFKISLISFTYNFLEKANTANFSARIFHVSFCVNWPQFHSIAQLLLKSRCQCPVYYYNLLVASLLPSRILSHLTSHLHITHSLPFCATLKFLSFANQMTLCYFSTCYILQILASVTYTEISLGRSRIDSMKKKRGSIYLPM